MELDFRRTVVARTCTLDHGVAVTITLSYFSATCSVAHGGESCPKREAEKETIFAQVTAADEHEYINQVAATRSSSVNGIVDCLPFVC